MKDTLIIPSKIKVGFQKREDTYTGMLAYVIYYDNKGVLRKEGSWQSWRDEKIDHLDLDNVPTSGFVLNKNVGGSRSGSYSWDKRLEKVRVYDPRGFEFEIGIPNLLFILQECTSTKGKGLDGDFVYSWSGTELVLLPTVCQQYKVSCNFTELQSKKITKDLITPGFMYMFKDTASGMYLGRHNTVVSKAINENDNYGPFEYSYFYVKSHVFKMDNGEYRYEKGFTKIGEKLTDHIDENYSNYLEQYLTGHNGSMPVDFYAENLILDLSNLIKLEDYHRYTQKKVWVIKDEYYAELLVMKSESDDKLSIHVYRLFKKTDSGIVKVKYNRDILIRKILESLNGVSYITQNSRYYTSSCTMEIDTDYFLTNKFFDLKFILDSGKISEI